MSRYRRRSLILWAVAAVLGVMSLAGSDGGAPAPQPARVQVVVLWRPVQPGQRLVAADLGLLSVRSDAAGSHQISDPQQAIGRRAAVALPAGSPLMDAELAPLVRVPAGRDVAVRLDDLAGLPATDLVGARADLYVTGGGTPSVTRRVLAGVLVVAASSAEGRAVATLRVPPELVGVAISAEYQGTVRLVARTPGSTA
ncbi:MAG: SAF domain-containing protein [Gaiellales bacterium]